MVVAGAVLLGACAHAAEPLADAPGDPYAELADLYFELAPFRFRWCAAQTFAWSGFISPEPLECDDAEIARVEVLHERARRLWPRVAVLIERVGDDPSVDLGWIPAFSVQLRIWEVLRERADRGDVAARCQLARLRAALSIERWVHPGSARGRTLDSLLRGYYAQLARSAEAAIRFAATVRLPRQVRRAHLQRLASRPFPEAALPERLAACDIDAEGESLLGTSP